MALISSKRFIMLSMAGLILASAALLAFFYVRTQGTGESGYFQNVATVRELKQLDAHWELDVMKSRIGIDGNYDALVAPLFDLGQLQQELRVASANASSEATVELAAADHAIGDAIRKKMEFIERFKSHNAILRNSLAFLPTAAADLRDVLSAHGVGPERSRAFEAAANASLLATMIYSQAPSGQAATAVKMALGRLEDLERRAPKSVLPNLDVLSAHIRVVLREQPIVNNLLRDVAAVPTNARIDAFDRLLSTEQKRIDQRMERARQYLLVFAAALVALLLLAGASLFRSHAEINRVNRALGEANTGLEQRVADRTHELSTINSELRQSEGRLAQQAGELEGARDAAKAANDAKSAFLATMSHELRTPLNAIIGFTELMQMSLFGPLGHPKYAEYITDIHKSGSHLLSLINDILDLSRLDAGKADLVDEVFSLEQMIGDIGRFLEPLARQGGLNIRKQFEPALPRLRADQRRIKQVILNLLSNAIKFTPSGGSITAEVTEVAGGLRLAIRDTGIGMTKEDLPKALERFGQVDTRLARKYEGTGLGLPLAKQLVELHDGTFEISSAPNIGTMVSIVFPPDRIVRDIAPLSVPAAGAKSRDHSMSAAAR